MLHNSTVEQPAQKRGDAIKHQQACKQRISQCPEVLKRHTRVRLQQSNMQELRPLNNEVQHNLWMQTIEVVTPTREPQEVINARAWVGGEVSLLMDSAHEGDTTRELAQKLGFVPAVPPNPQRKQSWSLDKQTYRRRNEVERLFRRLKAWHLAGCSPVMTRLM